MWRRTGKGSHLDSYIRRNFDLQRDHNFVTAGDVENTPMVSVPQGSSDPLPWRGRVSCPIPEPALIRGGAKFPKGCG